MESFTLSLSLACPGCEHPLPVNQMTDAVTCKACGENVPLPAVYWAEVFSGDCWPEALRLEPGEGMQKRIWGRYSAKVCYGRRAPRCPDCHVELGMDLRSDLDCPGCQRRIRVRPADALAQAVVPHAQTVVGEAIELASTGSEPVLFGCLACGAGLSVDGSARTVRCSHCGRDSYLPDDLWRRFNPVTKTRTFYVFADITPARAEQLRLLSGSWQERQNLAISTGNPDLLRTLAGDDDSDVREATAKNPSTPDDALLALLDREADHIMERSELSPRMLEALSHVSDYRARVRVAQHPDCALAWLERLAEDSDNDVRRAATQHPRWIAAHPVKKVVVADATWSPLILAVAGGTAFFVLFMGVLWLVEVSFQP